MLGPMLRRRHAMLIVGAAAVALTAAASASSLDALVDHGGPSMPPGLYLRTAGSIERGAIVSVRAVDDAPGSTARLTIAEEGDRLLQRVVAVAGDRVCASETTITLNGTWLANRLRHDAAGRALPRWEGCVTLSPQQGFLLGDTPDSVDGRYWGPTPIRRIEGVWVKL